MSEGSQVRIGPADLPGILSAPLAAKGLVIFADGGGSSRLSPRDRRAADLFNRAGFATLLFDLLSEREAEDLRDVFDIALLGTRVTQAVDWASDDARVLGLPIGLFGAGAGAAAAILAAAARPEAVGAVVSREGRPNLAGPALRMLAAPILLIVGSEEPDVLKLNETAMNEICCEKSLKIVPGAGRLFEEKATLDEALAAALEWCERRLRVGRMLFGNREQAGAALARRVARLALLRPVVYALPRGGVPVAIEVAKALNAPLDVLLVRKIGVPWSPELASGAVVEGEPPHFVFNRDVMAMAGMTEGQVRERGGQELKEIARRKALYRRAAMLSPTAKTAILVDDGVATGASVKAAIAAIRERKPGKIVVAVPVMSRDSALEIRGDVDAIVCLAAPADFRAVGEFYRDFRQLSDDEVSASLSKFARNS